MLSDVKSNVTHSLSYSLSVVLDSSMVGRGKGSMRREDLLPTVMNFSAELGKNLIMM
jgi:hypothetical protein